ncbi:hypothetical protein DVH05_016632 [Phytophthora capsici]|nr:hypothetical protein DVH05_016632 [Phytophthora capsici]
MTSRPVTTPVSTRGVPGLDVVSGPSSSGRPYSASNLPASIANARFKSFQVQYDILCRNPILAAIAQEIPWKNLFDLFLLKFFAVGDELWARGEQPHELAFVLCGGFIAKNIEEIETIATTDIFETEKPKFQVLAEKVIKTGGSLAAFSVLKGTPLPYAVVTMRFKSILLSLPSQRLKSVMRQLTPATQETVEQLIYENEQKLMESLSLPFRVRRDPRVSTAPAGNKHRATTPTTFSSRPKKRVPSAIVNRIMGSSERRQMKRSASTSAVADGAPSWASLQVAKPMEYEVNSSLLILHQSSSTGKLHLPSSTSTKNAALRPTNLSAVASQTARKHTQRRLDSIKLPTQTEAFPPRRLTDQRELLEKDGSGHCMEMVEQLLGKQLAKRIAADVVPKERVGRLLKPLKKPMMIPTTTTNNFHLEERRHGRRVLVANRCEHFRDASFDVFAD